MNASEQDLAQRIKDRKQRSYDWMKDNFYSEWETVFKAYKCVRDPELDPDGKPDKEATSVGMPLTYSHIRRNVARGTAQVPNLKFRAKDPVIGDAIGRTLMYQWDKGGVQRLQKRHFAQALMFGVSVRPWYWAVEEHMRSKRVDVLEQEITPEVAQRISDQYGVPMQYLMHPEVGSVVRARLLARHGRGNLLPLKYPYRGYVGPKCEFLFVGDCFFQPNFQSLQSSDWFIVERRRDMHWIRGVARRYPELAGNFELLLQQHPKGTPGNEMRRDTEGLRERMRAAIGHADSGEQYYGEDSEQKWTIVEMHVPGASPSISYVAEDHQWIGRIPYPYDLDGKIAFTDTVLIDDLLTGVGDSTARIIIGLQELYDRQANTRMGLVNNLLRPLIGTSNRELVENPEMIKRYGGFRLVPMRGPGDMWVQSEQAAQASAAAGLVEDQAVMRLYQMATGDTNMSMSANVDPQQARTATGAKILQAQQDILTKDLVDMFNITSIKADAEMMFMLNRSELSDAIEFNMSEYERNYSHEKNLMREEWAQVEPIHFQTDGEVVAEVGSTLADDDEARVAKAINLYQAAIGRPDLFNQQKARDEYLIAMGKGRELQQWAAPPQPPPPPEMNVSMSVSVKWEMLSEQERDELMKKAGVITMPAPGEMGPGGMPPAGMGLPPGMPGPPPPMGPGAGAPNGGLAPVA
jgi:hypothetical protein